MNTLFTAHATSKGGRAGRVTSDDGIIDFQLTMPKTIGGDGAKGTNPEQLFAAGYSACFSSALGMVAKAQNINPGAYEITGDVSLMSDGKAFKLGVTLNGKFPDLDKAKAEALMHAAHQVCPYSNATRNNVDVQLKVI